MTRKEFLKSAVTVVGGGMALSALGCGGGGPGPGECGTEILLNHGHTLTVTRAEAEEGVDKTYHIQGSALHDHTVDITAAQFGQLLAGTQLTITSSFDPGAFTHQHDVTVSCA